MKNTNQFISLRAIFFFSMILMAIMVFAGSISLYFFTDEMRGKVANARSSVESVRVAEQLQNSLLKYNHYGVLYSIGGEEKYLVLQQNLMNEIQSLLLQAREVEEEGDALGAVDEAEKKIGEYFGNRKRWSEMGLSAAEYMELSSRELNDILETLNKLTEMDVRQANMAIKEAFKLRETSLLFTSLLLLVFLALAAVLVFFWREFFFKPLYEIGNYLEQFSRAGKRPNIREQKTAEVRRIIENMRHLIDSVVEQDKRRLFYTAGIAHDLRSPLSAILHNLEFALLGLEKELSKNAFKKIVVSCKEQIDLMDSYIEQFLETSKVQAGQFDLDLKNEDLGAVLMGVVNHWQKLNPTRKISADIQSLTLPFDKIRMGQVFNNLLSNAIKYSDNSSTINIKLEKSGNVALFMIQDFGIGIEDYELENIFLPYQRSKLSLEVAHGTGLGLSNVKRIVEAHSGKVYAKSELGKGSTFFVELPMRDQNH